MLQCNIYRMATAMRELIELRLPAGRTLASYVATRRRRGEGWRRIADDLLIDTGVAVSFATLRRWFPEKRSAARVDALYATADQTAASA